MFWLLGIAIPCSAGVACPSADGRSDPKQPNVVIFFSDDQGTLDVNCYGSADLYTPTMDRLAQHGVRFTRAYAHIVCCPSRAMLMTGRYPQRGNVNMWTQGNAKGPPGRNLYLSEVTLAEALRGAGYKT
ncbi:MAG: sulfatase-like hydrolase/transferase, partial [Planctomycetaceae bacterium]|nr:sulfatase-like hydrolase/transferase [Planctomycetaceae bacterium]